MKILTKNGFNFAVGMFWQIPDYARKSVNLAKIAKETNNDMYCQISNLNSTFGFCSKNLVDGRKNIASLAKFIVETAKLTADYTASIICYKFKCSGDIDDDGNILKDDLFGYLVLLNGTICPIDGEYVGEFDLVRNSIIEQAKLHQIDTLYLPMDVADRFLNIFERLEYAYHTDEPNELLVPIMSNANKNQLISILTLLKENNSGNYNDLVTYLEKRIAAIGLDSFDNELNLGLLKKLISSEVFRLKIRDNVQTENNIRYLVASILQVPLSSDEIFWNNKLKQNHSKCLLRNIVGMKKRFYKILMFLSIFILLGYGFYYYFFTATEIINQNPIHPPVTIKAKLLPALQLISLCLGNNQDRFFGNQGNWNLEAIKCNSLSIEYQFRSSVPMTVIDLASTIGTHSGVSVVGNTGKYTKKLPEVRNLPSVQAFSKTSINEVLEQGVNDYAYKLKILPSKNSKKKILATDFVITANVSPLFLFEHGILNHVWLNEIDMKSNSTTGIYIWTIQGAF